MKRGFAGLAIVGIAAAVAVYALNSTSFSGMNLNYNGVESEFIKYLAKYGKSYDTRQEFKIRKFIFEETLKAVYEHNSRGDQTWEMAINQFADMLPHEVA